MGIADTTPGTGAGHGPLSGLRVVEIAHLLAGPVGGLLLADMGADVIKVERFPEGDDTRRMLPPDIEGESAAFMIVNRNKRGVAINLKNAAGVDVLHRLLSTADVVIENFRPGTLDKLGVGYEALRARNPALIYCRITGFGPSGPYAQRPGFDLIAQGLSGLMGLTGEGEGRPPVKVGVPIGDVTAGIVAAMGILAAYIQRLKSGKGDLVDTSLIESSVLHTYWQTAIALATGISPGPMGSAHPISAPYQAFRTQDGWINIGAANQANWLRLTDVLGAPELAREARFLTNADRRNHLGELEKVLSPLFANHTTSHWLRALDKAGVPAGPVLNVGEVHRDPQVMARSMIVEVDHPVAGTVKALGCPVKFSGKTAVTRRASPMLGQHTREVLGEIGFTASAIDELAYAKAIGIAPHVATTTIHSEG